MEANSQSILESIFVFSDKNNADSLLQKQICWKMIFACARENVQSFCTQWKERVESRLERSGENRRAFWIPFSSLATKIMEIRDFRSRFAAKCPLQVHNVLRNYTTSLQLRFFPTRAKCSCKCKPFPACAKCSVQV